jgi:hypothetical protein
MTKNEEKQVVALGAKAFLAGMFCGAVMACLGVLIAAWGMHG